MQSRLLLTRKALTIAETATPHHSGTSHLRSFERAELVLHFSINAKNYQPYASFYYRVKLREFGSGVFSRELPVAL